MSATSGSEPGVRFSVVIPTYNRAEYLRETLRSVAGLSSTEPWECVVVDNNSRDHTRAVVDEAARQLPLEIRYVFEAEQGRCAALNAGILASRGEIIATLDDDMWVEGDWLERAAQALDRLNCDYVGSRVLPVWSGARPTWIPDRGGRHWSVIGLVDYGTEPVEFSPRVLPSGIMAFRRDAFTRAGLWDNRVGRRAGTLLGQEVREWSWRARDAGLTGFYVPTMVVHHRIPPDRVSKRYFRRWFYWHGVSRALLYEQSRVDMETPEETTLDFSKVPHIAGVPRYMFRTFVRSSTNIARAFVRGDAVATFENELWLWFFAGVVKQRWRDRKKRSPVNLQTANVADTER